MIVTAEKRTEDLQKVPISIQVLDTAKLEQLNITKFNDYINFLPTVSYESLRPGTAQVYMRGVSSGGDGNHSGSLPSVGVYLDEQPVTTINEVLDVHIYDVARIETLVGPQGTLFGASSEAGTLRIITNKPDPVAFRGRLRRRREHGRPWRFRLYGRGLCQHPAERQDGDPPRRLARARCGLYRQRLRHAHLSGQRHHREQRTIWSRRTSTTSTTDGFRAALKVDLNDNWTVTPSVIYQTQKSNGVFDYSAAVGDLKVKRFNPDHFKDEWVQAALTVDGKIGDVDVTYAGAYMNRHEHSISDYSAYSEYASWIENYYTCYFGPCTDPTMRVDDRRQFPPPEPRTALPVRAETSACAGSSACSTRTRPGTITTSGTSPGLNPAAVVTPPDDQYQTKQERVDSEFAGFGEITLRHHSER